LEYVCSPHVIEEENDDMQWQSKGEDNGTYSATGMALSE
jgi:hypothetical protein